MKAQSMVVALVGILGSGAVSAAEASYDGNELLGQCQQYIKAADKERNYDPIAAGLCLGFIHGVDETVTYLRGDLAKDAKFCTPKDITNGQVVRIVVKYLKDNPKLLHKSRGALVWLALNDAYPCK
ncbi:hypothetical protein CRX42_13770 [Pseudomonas jessenii]|uniref:Rap1a immunity protein domain-containing protein n=1 Tax=Pseudomonas jessenii TaxID=77298 RepID=A0A2W0EN96_PSEJE|nr:Rap1a/Tai family immunity protein [Pseudomonas jessenii]PYY69969.1 hypothetical protein CRX42_13770 [Pseudomonas jessenii]